MATITTYPQPKWPFPQKPLPSIEETSSTQPRAAYTFSSVANYLSRQAEPLWQFSRLIDTHIISPIYPN